MPILGSDLFEMLNAKQWIRNRIPVIYGVPGLSIEEVASIEAQRFGCPAVSLSEPFENGLALLRVAEERGLEGIVSKRRDAPYRSGECRDWRKVKTLAWREANREPRSHCRA